MTSIFIPFHDHHHYFTIGLLPPCGCTALDLNCWSGRRLEERTGKRQRKCNMIKRLLLTIWKRYFRNGLYISNDNVISWMGVWNQPCWIRTSGIHVHSYMNMPYVTSCPCYTICRLLF